MTHTRKKIEIIVERPLAPRIIDAVKAAGATGYTVLPVISGAGHQGEWERDDISGASAMIMIMVVTTVERCDQLIDRINKVLSAYACVVFVSEVQVIRQDHF